MLDFNKIQYHQSVTDCVQYLTLDLKKVQHLIQDLRKVQQDQSTIECAQYLVLGFQTVKGQSITDNN